MSPKPLALIVLDGWGHRDEADANAIEQAKTPTWHRLWNAYPHALLGASGLDVGLPEGQMGNSEVGHLNIGAGRILYQDSVRITNAIKEGTFASNPVFQTTCRDLQKSGKTLHLMGLVSDGGVHSLEEHLVALIPLAESFNIPVQIHAFLDGRDTPPKSAVKFLSTLEAIVTKTKQTKIASIMGRYYAMDRDKRWERTTLAYNCLTQAESPYHASTALEALEMAYARAETDEFVQPTRIAHTAPIQSGDAVIFFNFRTDRARQLSYALSNPDFQAFKRTAWPQLSHFVSFTEYATDLRAEIAFPPTSTSHTLGAVLADRGLKQLRLAETEKYAHVTFFFNGGEEVPFKNEERILIPSPKVATYDLQPEMSAPALTDAFVQAIESKQYDVIICNYANADMVGHTGNFEATLKAIETLDHCLERVITALQSAGGAAFITADHGNADQMYDAVTKQAHTAHTLSKVPLLYVGDNLQLVPSGRLCDIAPTMLALLNIPIPEEMTGHSLIANAET